MTGRASALELARQVLGEHRCWVVGGAVRDELLGAAPSTDLDLVIAGDVATAARALARAAGAKAFSLSDDFGAWRVVARARGWQADLNPLRGESLTADLLLRDFTINAIARPLAGGELIDPLGGARDLAARRLRIVAPTSLSDDPLRALRLVRLACELGLEADPQAREAARAAAPGLAGISSERVYAELRRVIATDRAAAGMRLALELGLCAVVLPELEQLRGVRQSRYHHLDVLEHTLEVLESAVTLERSPETSLGDEHAAAVRRLLERPLADELTRGEALRFAALLHDVAKPHTRTVAPDGRVGFPGHDRLGAEIARGMLTRLRAAERIRAHVAALTLNHLRLGFLVARAPLSRRELYRYLDACDPVWADVTLLSVADRLATRGDRAQEAIERHLALARSVIGEALEWQAHARPAALVRGDQLAGALGIAPGPLLGELLAAIAEEAFAGELHTPEDAIAFAAARIA
ncbi:MAG: HDIG domain-containing metalloprotein [Solirubrobacteraceae bacterium]